MSKELQFYVTDTETSSLSAKAGEVNQATVIRCLDRMIMNKYIKMEHPEWVQQMALISTGRTLSDLNRGVSKEEAVKAIHDFMLKDGVDPEFRCMIGYNVGFDRKFLQALWKKCGYKEFPAYLWLDLLPFSKQYAKENNITSPNFKLGTTLQFMGIKQVKGELHEAAVDSKNTYLLYEKLKKSGVSHLPFMKRFAEEEE